MNILHINTDGACDNKSVNKYMGVGIQAKNDLGEVVYEMKLHCGSGTSNIAEWIGLIEGLRFAERVQHKYDQIYINMDSQLVVKQFNGEWRLKQEHLEPYRKLALKAANNINVKRLSGVFWFSRDFNTAADKLSKEALQLDRWEGEFTGFFNKVCIENKQKILSLTGRVLCEDLKSETYECYYEVKERKYQIPYKILKFII